jgi:hypothetical protein
MIAPENDRRSARPDPSGGIDSDKFLGCATTKPCGKCDLSIFLKHEFARSLDGKFLVHPEKHKIMDNE